MDRRDKGRVLLPLLTFLCLIPGTLELRIDPSAFQLWGLLLGGYSGVDESLEVNRF